MLVLGYVRLSKGSKCPASLKEGPVGLEPLKVARNFEPPYYIIFSKMGGGG